jgi:hypothetical protein
MLDPGRTLEFHFSVQQGMSLFAGFLPGAPRLKNPGPEMTSFALSIDPDQVQLDMWMPARECRPILQQTGW